MSIISDYKKRFILPDDECISEDNRSLYLSYNQELLLQSAIDYDDILFYAYQVLTEYENVRHLFTSQYKYICVDEAQDLNYAQYMVIKALCGNAFKNIMLVGDENQSIYGFNGSDSTLMSKVFVKDFAPVIYVLNENFRCSKAIVNFANTLEASTDYPNCFYEGELKFHQFLTEQEEAEFVVAKITELIGSGHPDVEGPLSYDSFAIIARNKYVFANVEQELARCQIPYYFKKTTNGIDSESIIFKIFDLELRLLLNNRDIIHARELQSIRRSIPNNVDVSFIHSIVSTANIEEFNLKNLLNKMEKNFDSLLLSDEEKYMMVNDCALWLKHWNKYVSQVPAGQRSLQSFRNYVSLGKTQILDSTSGVSLLTAHMSKGLQYEAVFIIGLSEGVFPDYRALQTGGKALDQEKNNMYVAVTRAKRLCYLSYSKVKTMPWGSTKIQQPSQFVSTLL